MAAGGRGYLALVEHGDLDEDDGEGGGAELGVVVGDGVAAVAAVGAAAQDLDAGDDHRHVHPLQEQQHRHGQAHRHRQPQQRHDHRRPHLRPRLRQPRRPAAVHLHSSSPPLVGLPPSPRRRRRRRDEAEERAEEAQLMGLESGVVGERGRERGFYKMIPRTCTSRVLCHSLSLYLSLCALTKIKKKSPPKSTLLFFPIKNIYLFRSMENGMVYVKFPSVLNMPTYDGRNDLSYTNRNRLIIYIWFLGSKYVLWQSKRLNLHREYKSVRSRNRLISVKIYWFWVGHRIIQWSKFTTLFQFWQNHEPIQQEIIMHVKVGLQETLHSAREKGEKKITWYMIGW